MLLIYNEEIEDLLQFYLKYKDITQRSSSKHLKVCKLVLKEFNGFAEPTTMPVAKLVRIQIFRMKTLGMDGISCLIRIYDLISDRRPDQLPDE